MDREANEEKPSLLSNNNNNKEKTPRGGSGGGGGDRLKRDEWSEGAVACLLEAYEAKWILRNRAKLKGQDWEDVAKYVSSRADCTKFPKTQTQCKNKIESMKKRYRSESATADASSWPLFQRLDLLLRGSAPPPLALPLPAPPPPTKPSLMLLEPSLPPQSPVAPLPPPPPPLGVAQNSHDTICVDWIPKVCVDRIPKEDGVNAKSFDHVLDKDPPINAPVDTDSSTPALYCNKEKSKSKTSKTIRVEKKKRKRIREDREVGESIRWVAEAVLRSEQARMDTMREVERMRAEAEAKRGEMDLKRTEIIANTQLEIARLFAGFGKGIDSSLRVGRS